MCVCVCVCCVDDTGTEKAHHKLVGNLGSINP